MSVATTTTVAASQPEVKKNKITLTEKLKKYASAITVEPVIASYIFGGGFCLTAINNLEFEKSCRVDNSFNDTICEAILNADFANYTDENLKVQEVISAMHSWQQPIQNVVPIILILFLGPYSDRHKIRKPFLIAPLIGEFIAAIGLLLCVVYMREWPVAVQGVLQTIIPSFFGAQTMLVTAVFSYIADVSTEEMRTLRMGIVQLVLSAVFPIALTISGSSFSALGYYWTFGIAACLYLFGILYAYFMIKEKRKAESYKTTLQDMLDPTLIVDMFSLIFVNKPGRKRIFVIAIMAVSFLSLGVDGGELSVFFLFVQQYLTWLPQDYSYFIAYNTIIHLIGTAAGVWFFTKLWKLSDHNIINISFADKVISNIFLAFATTNTLLYIATFVSIITGLDNVAIRSLSTKIVTENDFAKIQSLFGIFEALGQAAAAPVYNTIYINSYTTFPGLFFILSAILIFVCMLIIWFMQFGGRCMRRRDDDMAHEVTQKNETELYGIDNVIPVKDEITHI